MSILKLAASLITSTATLCSPTPEADHTWLPGEFYAQAAPREFQAELIDKLENSSIIEIDNSAAEKFIKINNHHISKKYYIAKIGYFGNDRPPQSYPSGLSLSVDVDNNDIAYVTSYRLTSERSTSELVVVLTSQVELKGVVSICGAAE